MIVKKGRFVRQPREEKKTFRQRDDKKSKSDRKCFRCGDPIISLANIQSLNEGRIKRHSLEVLGAIAKMNPRTKPTMKLVSWLNRRI
nr:zf-CCHC domain-containing protein/UBN2 domain-containing protein [Tanacetum cinerariifolium]